MEKILKNPQKSDTKINLSSIYTEKEIESMKKLFPKLSSLITTNPSKSTKRSSMKVSKPSQFIDKEQFVKLIAEKMMNTLKKEDSKIIEKSISYILNSNNERKNDLKDRENTDNSARVTKNHIFVNFSEKSKINGDIVLFQQKRQKKKSSLKTKSRNKNDFGSIKKSMKNKNMTNINNTVSSKLGKKFIDIKLENEASDYKIKNIKSNSIINNFITFSNTTQPEQIILYGNNSPNSRHSNGMNNSLYSNKSSNNRENEKGSIKKFIPINIFSHYLTNEKINNIDEKNNNNNNNIKSNTQRSNQYNTNYVNNFIKKIEKIKTEVNLEKRKTTFLKNKRKSDINKNDKVRISLTNMKNTNSKDNKKLSIQIKVNSNPKEIENIRNIDLMSNSSIESKDFNIFNFEEKVGKENTLYLVGFYIYKKFDFSKIIKQTKFVNWSKKITSGYSRLNPYHTDLHAGDVTQTCFLSLVQEGVISIAKVNNIDICALILSCMCHDLKHGGLNNNFLKLTKDKLAIRYNDISILENMHISETFKLINSNKECDIFSGVDNTTYEKMRKKMIACVLSTDMFYHSEHIQFMKDFIEKKKNNSEDHQQFMNLLIHSADISNPTKSFNIYLKWAKLVFEEFCQQGDKEKALGLVCTCDRNKVKLSTNQIGFIDYVVEEFVSNFVQVFPSLKFLYDNLVANRQKLVNYKDEENNNNGNNNKKLIKSSIKK